MHEEKLAHRLTTWALWHTQSHLISLYLFTCVFSSLHHLTYYCFKGLQCPREEAEETLTNCKLVTGRRELICTVSICQSSVQSLTHSSLKLILRLGGLCHGSSNRSKVLNGVSPAVLLLLLFVKLGNHCDSYSQVLTENVAFFSLE